MTLNAKELIEISNRADERALKFAKYCLKNIKKSNRKNFFIYKKQNKVVADEFTLKEILNLFHKENYNNLVNK